jgi:Holliday junction DNA helicase RuvA
MISHITGRVKFKKDLSVIIEAGNFCYEVMIPPVIMDSLDKIRSHDGTVTLVTFHYYQMEPSRAYPVLIGFSNDIEKEFFEQFIKVSGVGPKAACRALSLPFSVIAGAIDRGDAKLLKTLPGIGEQKAREIVAKLQGKVGKFGLIQDSVEGERSKAKEDIKEEALSVLLQLQYKKPEAAAMIEKAIERNPKVSTCEEILNEVYKGAK